MRPFPSMASASVIQFRAATAKGRLSNMLQEDHSSARSSHPECPASPFQDNMLEMIRDRFHHVLHCPYEGPRVYFENAGASLTLKSVVKKTAEIAAVPDNEGRDNASSRAMSVIVEQGRSDCAAFLGARSGRVFVGETGTECLFRLVRAAALASPVGGNVVAGALEHPATLSATAYWAEHSGRSLVSAPFDNHTASISPEAYAECVTADTRLATIIHTSPISGAVVDVATVARRIRDLSPDCYIIVDGIQHAPHGHVDVAALDVDAYALSPYKMFSRMNHGFAWVSDRLSTVAHEKLIGKPVDFWELGTRDASVYASFSEVVRYLEWLGSQFATSTNQRDLLNAAGSVIAEHERHLLGSILYGADEQPGLKQMPGLRILGPRHLDQREGVVSFSVPGRASRDLVAALRARGIRAHTRADDAYSGHILRPLGLTDCVRVSPGHYNTSDEVRQFLAALAELF